MSEFSSDRRRSQIASEREPRRIAGALDRCLAHIEHAADRPSSKFEHFANLIRSSVKDPDLAEAIVNRVALAAADGLISGPRLERKLDYLARCRREGKIRNPGGYFVACVMEMFQQAGLPWSTA